MLIVKGFNSQWGGTTREWLEGDYQLRRFSYRGLDADGNLQATADFRGLYAAILEDWLGADADAIIPGARKFARPKILR